MMRGIVVLALVAGLSFAARSFLIDTSTLTGSGAALAFGFLLLAALQVGHIVQAMKMPHLTGFLICGAVFGPEVLGLITRPMLGDLALVKNVAVGLIALSAGCELNFKRLAPLAKSIGLVSTFSLGLAFLLLFGFFLGISRWMPLTSDMSFSQRVVVALILANVLAALSPAVVMGILSESRAEGPLSELCLSIVVIADLVISIAFAFSDTVARQAFPVEGAAAHSIFGALAFHILGSIAAGVVVGIIFAVYIRRVALRISLFVFAVCFVVAEAGNAISLNPLLVGLSAGLFLENVSPVSGHEVIHQMEPAATPTFAVFFAVIGAEVHLRDFVAVAPVAIAAALVRFVGLSGGAWIGARAARLDAAVAKRIKWGLLPQAGVAIALADLVGKTFMPWGPRAATLLLGSVMVSQLIGPIVFRSALEGAGEVGKKRGEGAVGKPSHASIPEDLRAEAFAAAVARASSLPPPPEPNA